jgi:transcription termination factor Rho
VSVLQRKELEESPLADLHAIASELGIERFRALRRSDLIAAIVGAQGIEADREDEDAAGEGEATEAPPDEAEREAEGEETEQAEEPEPEPVSGVLDVLQAGSGFLRVKDGDDVYVSPAQIRRCELRAGDEVAGPLRPARRNERHPSLVRVETVNGRDAEPPEERPHFSELTPVYPSERLAAPPELAAVPYAKGSRVAISGPPGAGGTRLLGAITEALSKDSETSLSVVLVGSRPEELTAWRQAAQGLVSGGSFDQPHDAQVQAAELAVERGKRVVERGGDAMLVIDSLSSIPPGAARRIFGAARKVQEGGSLTVFATVGDSEDAQRQASTHVALDPPGPDGLPRVSDSRSHTQRADLIQ